MSAAEVTRIVAVRHGETDWNAALRIQGHADIALNARGLRQAACVAEALADDPLDAVYASDLVRALDTARAVAQRQGVRLVAEPGLRERGFGHFEGLTFAEIEACWPDSAARWRAREPGHAPGGGETLASFYRRCVETVERLAAAHLGGAIAVVAHGGVLDCLYRAATRTGLQAARSWPLANATVNRLLYSPQGLSLVGWNDARHLEGGALDELR